MKAVRSKRSPKRATISNAVSMPSNERDSISIRPIENGYIVRRSSCDKKGNYTETEMFTPKKPDLSIGKMTRK